MKKVLERKNLLLLISTLLLILALAIPPTVNGDGAEYLGVSLSIKNHFSADLRKNDIVERQGMLLLSTNLSNWTDEMFRKTDYYNYFKSEDNKFYGYHFWGYSALCSVFLPFFLILKVNPLKIFQFTNALLLILLFWWIWYKTTLSDKIKYYLTVITLISPIWFYFKWMHPEIFTYVFIYIGILEFLEKRKVTACLFGAVASLQNPGAIMLPFFIIIYDFIKKMKIDKELISLGLVSLLGLFPYLFYFVHFHKFSLVAAYTTSIHYVTLNKILSLLFDLNFGLIIYIPVLVLGLFYLCFRKNKLAIVTLILLLCIGFVDATQFNWNSDLNLVHRYAFWLIPFIIIVNIKLIEELDVKKLKYMFLIYLITTGFWLVYGLDRAATYYAKFQPIAQFVLNTAPALYNPDADVFAERTTQVESYPIEARLPITYYYKTEMRKTLIKDPKTGKLKYINGKVNFKNIGFKPITIKHKGKKYDLTLHGIVESGKY